MNEEGGEESKMPKLEKVKVRKEEWTFKTLYFHVVRVNQGDRHQHTFFSFQKQSSD
jgi:hypothetical protein